MARKYLPGGALNPEWCIERDVEIETKRITDSLCGLLEDTDIELNLQLGEGVGINISRKKEPKNMCNIISTENDYAAKFDFLKKHSGSPEDLELAMKIVGLK